MGKIEDDKLIEELGLKQIHINNRRYLGNKYSISSYIKKIVEDNCKDINIFIDIFSGTGSVSNVFTDKIIITNDILYSNYLSNYAWFYPEDYSSSKIINLIYGYNNIETNENNYMKKKFF